MRSGGLLRYVEVRRDEIRERVMEMAKRFNKEENGFDYSGELVVFGNTVVLRRSWAFGLFVDLRKFSGFYCGIIFLVSFVEELFFFILGSFFIRVCLEGLDYSS